MSVRSRLGRTPTWVVALAVAAGLVAVGMSGGARAGDPGDVIPPPTAVPVVSTALVCPAPIADATRLSTAVTFAAAALPGLPPTPAGSAAIAGSAGIGALGKGEFTPQKELAAVGTADGFRVPGKSIGPVLALGAGALAPGLAADQLTRGNDGPARGLAVQPCGAPVSDAWFIGGGSVVGDTTSLFLSNVEGEPAQVDLEIYGGGGPIDAPNGRGIVVPPYTRLVLAVSALAPGQPVVAVHVMSRVGRVSPAMLDNLVSGRDPRGLEYLPVTDAQRRVVLPVVLGGAGARELRLLAPVADGTVSVSVLTADGALTPVGLESVTAPVGKIIKVPLEKVAGQQNVGLVLTSDTPIVAGVHMAFTGQLTDTAEVAGTPALDAPAVITGLFATQDNAVLLAAPAAGARLRMTTYGVGGTAKPTSSTRQITVAAGTTTAVGVTIPTGAAWAWVLLEPDPGSGPVHALRRSSERGTRGALVTTAPVLALRPIAQIPTAVFQVGG